MASKISNIKTYFNKYSKTDNNLRPGPSAISLTVQHAAAENVKFADDGRAYALFKRPLTKREMQALNAKRNDARG